jgi:hypothetical protein
LQGRLEGVAVGWPSDAGREIVAPNFCLILGAVDFGDLSVGQVLDIEMREGSGRDALVRALELAYAALASAPVSVIPAIVGVAALGFEDERERA